MLLGDVTGGNPIAYRIPSDEPLRSSSRFYLISHIHKIRVVRCDRMSEEADKDLINKLLKGRTMSVYALLLQKGEMGVRDVQRALRFSSPSLALHHLTKLSELDLVSKDIDGVYSVKRTVRVGSLSLFIKFGTRLLPRFLFLGTLFSAMLVVYLLIFASWPLTGGDIMFISMSIIAVLLSLNETRRIWLLKPF